MKTKVLKAYQIQEASQILKEGGLLAFPTDTIFGIGARACDGEAVRRVFEAKQRPLDKALIILCSSIEMVEEYGDLSSSLARELANKYWPGPLTLVLPQKKGRLPRQVTAGKDTIAIRVPDQAETLALIDSLGEAIVAPSANLAGEDVCESTQEILDVFDGKIDAVLELEEGANQLGQASTIVEIIDEKIIVHRQGGLHLK